MRYVTILFLYLLLFITSFAVPAQKNTITLNLNNAPLRETLYALAKTLNYSVMLSDKISGTITLEETQLHAASLLNIISKQYNIKWEKHGNLLIFTTAQEWLAQQQREEREKLLVSNSEPLQLALITLRYAKASTLVTLINNAKPGSLLSKRGNIEADNRTNTLIVHDTHTALRLIKTTVAALDKPVRQLLIETYLVSIDHDNEHELGLSLTNQGQDNSRSHTRFPLTINKWPITSPLDVTLLLMEKRGQVDIISSPRLFTADQETASIETGEEVPYQESSENGGTTVAFKKAVLGLKMTPHILPGGRIALNLQMNHDIPTNRLINNVPTITTRQITTNVILNNKETIILGGIYEKEAEQSILGIIGLNKIPLLGHIFTKRIEKQHKRELLIFVTPMIMNK